MSTTSPPPSPPSPSRKLSLRKIPATSGPAPILSALAKDGAVIIKNLFPPSLIEALNSDVSGPLSSLSPGCSPDQSDPWLVAFHGNQTKRLNNVVSHSPTFRHQILENELVHSLCSSIFLEDAGGYWMNSAQVIAIGPHSAPQPLHRDQWQFPIFTVTGPETTMQASINFVVALTKFTEENGATRVIPGSHLWADFKENGTQEQTVAAEMEVGDACFITGKVVHGGGANVTENETRRGITLVFQCSYLTPEEAYPFLVSKDVAKGMTERGQRMIGFRSQFLKDSPGVWKGDYGKVDESYC
ncbi:hypothetical protein QBC35DRAFT_444805 [Podospora australis]|uniref:Dioxygenase n=1 Tax=Podospora australis TaxID=1536484 RepID=A0AAN7AD02_9PEZI|nr:hypothetical protein QBC35DRAFT_444805 [Podospora australis]